MSIIFHAVGFEWPNGEPVFAGINLSLAANGKYGLVGPNGVGKSTLARLIQGELQLTAGAIKRTVHVSCFPQWQTPPMLAVADYLDGLWQQITPEDTALVLALLTGIEQDAACNTLSGGEWTRVRLARLLASDSELLILDEPTNNLDRAGRDAVCKFVGDTTRAVLVISHDRELLERVDVMLELSNQGLAVYGGNWSLYQAERIRERAKIQQQLDRLRDERNQARREQTEKLAQQQKRMQRGQRNAPDAGLPKLLSGMRKRQAQQTLGKLHTGSLQRLQEKALAAQTAFASLKSDPVIAGGFAQTVLPAGKLVMQAHEFNFRFSGASTRLWRRDLNLTLQGPQRLCLRGANGSGKSTLLRLLTMREMPMGESFGELRLGNVVTALVDQQLTLSDPGQSVFDYISAGSARDVVTLRNSLAQWLFAGANADQPVQQLSGGEKLRAALAAVVLADPVPQLLILDEPTNNLDLPNLELLEQALTEFGGALIVVSHDESFLQRIGITQEWVLS